MCRRFDSAPAHFGPPDSTKEYPPVAGGFFISSFLSNPGTRRGGRDVWGRHSGARGSILGSCTRLRGRRGAVCVRAGTRGWEALEGRVFLSAIPAADVTGRHVFYNNSGLDGFGTQAAAADDGAIAT